MKSNVIVALIVGAVLGFVVGRATGSGSAGIPAAPTLAQAPSGAPAASDVGKTPADLPETYIKESDLPAGSFAGLTEQQKYSALKAANEANCDCGCQNDSIAKCRKNDPNCARAPAMLTQVIALAKQGRSAEQIKGEVGKKPSAAPANRPPDDSNVTYKVPIDDAYCRGPKTARVTIVESTDFQ
jgi:hypothetical protein